MSLGKIIVFWTMIFVLIIALKKYFAYKKKMKRKRQEELRKKLQKKIMPKTTFVKSESDSYFENLNSDNYRKHLYDKMDEDFKPILNSLFQEIDKLSHKETDYINEIEHEIYSSVEDILTKANWIEWRINNYWNGDKYRKDFIFYIGLHYTSHLLGIALREEQQKIKDIFVQYKKKQEQWDNVIRNAQAHRETLHGEERRKRSEDIERMYKIHKNISVVKGKIGEINTKFRERMTSQFIETGKRRDYIGTHCGERGAKWRAKILANHPSS